MISFTPPSHITFYHAGQEAAKLHDIKAERTASQNLESGLSIPSLKNPRLRKNRYYKKNYPHSNTSTARKKRWTKAEVDLILTSTDSDSQLALALSRSICAIQVKRHKALEVSKK